MQIKKFRTNFVPNWQIEICCDVVFYLPEIILVAQRYCGEENRFLVDDLHVSGRVVIIVLDDTYTKLYHKKYHDSNAKKDPKHPVREKEDNIFQTLLNECKDYFWHIF